MSAEELLTDLGKLRVADHARLMADNQRILDAIRKDDDWQRDLNRRVSESQAAQQCGPSLPPVVPPVEPASEEPVNIFVDSPITHYHPPASPAAVPTPGPQVTPSARAPAAASVGAKLAPWAMVVASVLGAGGLGSGVTAYLLTKDAANGSPMAADPVYDVEAWKPPAKL